MICINIVTLQMRTMQEVLRVLASRVLCGITTLLQALHSPKYPNLNKKHASPWELLNLFHIPTQICHHTKAFTASCTSSAHNTDLPVRVNAAAPCPLQWADCSNGMTFPPITLYGTVPFKTGGLSRWVLYLKIYLFIFRERGREGERERNISVWEKHWSVASRTCPNQGPNLQPRHVPWPGIKLATLSFAEGRSSNWATAVRA